MRSPFSKLSRSLKNLMENNHKVHKIELQTEFPVEAIEQVLFDSVRFGMQAFYVELTSDKSVF